MHRVIAGTAGHLQTDHKDGDGLNNRRSNLRPCTSAQNKANVGLRSDNRSGFRGVSRNAQDNCWIARIQGRHIGVFRDAVDAARAYDDAARKAFGEFAHLNFPDE
jgi:hypothetical protein